jgi:hypothetical protein
VFSCAASSGSSFLAQIRRTVMFCADKKFTPQPQIGSTAPPLPDSGVKLVERVDTDITIH